MKFKDFKQEIEKLGLYIKEDESHIKIYTNNPNLEDFISYCASISKEYRDSLSVYTIYEDNWSRNKQKRFMELCTKFAMTKPEER